MAKTAVVILNFNGKHYLQQFLPGVLANSPEAEVVVADNGSTDDSLEFMAQAFPQVRCLAMPTNTGFSEGYNRALAQVQADYYVLLNSDVEVPPGWLGPLVGLMDSDPDIAACQPCILSYHDRTKFEYAGAAGGFIDLLGYPFCRGRIFDVVEENIGQYTDTVEIFWATGACMVVRAADYHALGGLDPDFFAHMEEIDLCWRLKNAGRKVYYCGQSTVYHVGGGTLAYQHPRKTYLNFRNGLVMMVKNLNRIEFFPLLFFRLVLDGVAGLKFLFSLGWPHTWAIVRAHLYLYQHLGMLARKRKRARAGVQVFHHPQVMEHSLLWDFYVRGRKTFGQLGFYPEQPKW
jgi:GT2 family glycosyltransferase